jgi:trigger factor
MQISVDSTGPLERRLKVEVPEDRIAEEVAARLKRLSRNSRIDGFRPGRTPLKIVEKRFGGRVRQEVVNDVVRDSFREAVVQQKLRPVSQPQIDPIAADPGCGLSYTATFEVYPELSLAHFSELIVERPVCDIEASDIDKMIESLRHQQRTWEPVDRAAGSGDRVIVDFVGRVSDKEFSGGRQEDFAIELGAHRLLEGFEDGLVGVRAGEERVLDLRFPDDYPRSELAGQPVRFDVVVKSVERPRLPELDPDFFKKFGVEDGVLETFRAEVRKNMEREKEQALRNRLKNNVVYALSSVEGLQLPNVLVSNECERLSQETRRRLLQVGAPAEKIEGLTKEMFETEARRRVALGLTLAEIVRTNALAADAAKVRSRVEAIASSYEDPDAVVKWYYENPAQLGQIESAVVEDEAVDWVLERVRLAERKYAFDDLMNPGQTDSQRLAELKRTY